MLYRKVEKDGKARQEALICSTNLPRPIGRSLGCVALEEGRSKTISSIFFLSNAA
jgi:hypothetical protein